MIFQTLDNLFYVYNGAYWAEVGAGDNLGSHTATENMQINGNWISNDGGDEGIQIADNGNVGVGTVNHAFAFEVWPGTDTSMQVGLVHIGHPLINNWASFSHVDMATSSSNYALAQNQNGRTFLNAEGTQHIQFRVGNTEVARVSSEGIGIGGNGPNATYALRLGTSANAKSAIATAWDTYSDKRLKTNIKLIPNSLDKLSQINGYYYNWKKSTDKTVQVGVMAQEVREVLPEVVTEDGEGFLAVDYSKITALLIEATKELKEEKDKEIKALKEEVDLLRKMIEKK